MHLNELFQQLVTAAKTAASDPVAAAFAKYPRMPVEEFVRILADAITDLQHAPGYAEMSLRQAAQQRQLHVTYGTNTATHHASSFRPADPLQSSFAGAPGLGPSPASSSGVGSNAALLSAVAEDGHFMTVDDVAPVNYLTLKKMLFVTHGEMDADGDGLITHGDFIDFLLDSRKRQLGVVLGEVPSFEVDRALAFRSHHAAEAANAAAALGGGRAAMMRRQSALAANPSPSRRRSSARPATPVQSQDDDRGTLLAFDPIVTLKSMRGGKKIFAIGRMQRVGFLSADTHAITSELAQPPTNGASSMSASSNHRDGDSLGLGFSCAVRWPTSRVTDADLLSQEPVLVTAHRDRAVVLWKERSVVAQAKSNTGGGAHRAIGEETRQWFPFYDFTCEHVQTAVSSHPTADIVFSGGSQGDIKMWRLSTELIADFTRGERTALARISARAWAPGERHNGTITGIAYLRQGARVVSAAMDATLAEYDVEKEYVVARYIHTSGIHCIASSIHLPDFIIGCGFGPSPCLWDLNATSDKPLLLSDFADPHRQALVSVGEIRCSLPLLVSCDATSKIKIWDLRMMSCLQTIVADREGLSEAAKAATGSSCTGSGGGASGGGSAADTAGGTSKVSLCTMKVPLLTTMTTTSAGQVLTSGRVYSVVASNTNKMTAVSRHQQQAIIGTAFDTSSNCLLTLHLGCVVRWEHGAPRSSYRLQLKDAPVAASFGVSGIFPSPTPTCIALDPRGRHFLIGGSDGLVRSFKIGTGEFVSNLLSARCEIKAIAGSATLRSSVWTVVAVSIDGSVVYAGDRFPKPRVLHVGNSSVTCIAMHGTMIVAGTAEGEILAYSASSVASVQLGPLFTYKLQDVESFTCITVVKELGLAIAGTSHGMVVMLNLHRSGEVLLEMELPVEVHAPMEGSLAESQAMVPPSPTSSSPGSGGRLGSAAPRLPPIASVGALFFYGMSWRMLVGLDDGQTLMFRMERTVLCDDVDVREESISLQAHHPHLFKDAVVSIAAAGNIAYVSGVGETVVLALNGAALATLAMVTKEALHLGGTIRVAQAKDAALINNIHKFLSALRQRAMMRAMTRRLLTTQQRSVRPDNMLVSDQTIARIDFAHHPSWGMGAGVPPKDVPPAGAAIGSQPTATAAAASTTPTKGGLPSTIAADLVSAGLRQRVSLVPTASFRRSSAGPMGNPRDRRDTITDEMSLAEEKVLAKRICNPIFKIQPPPRPVTAAARGTLPLPHDGPRPLVPSRDIAGVPLSPRRQSLAMLGGDTQQGGIGGISSQALQLLATRLPAFQLKNLRGAAGATIGKQQQPAVVLGVCTDGKKPPPAPVVAAIAMGAVPRPPPPPPPVLRGMHAEVSPRALEHALVELSKVEAAEKAAKYAPKRPMSAKW